MYQTLYFNKRQLKVLRLTLRNAAVISLLLISLYFGFNLYQKPKAREVARATGVVIGQDVENSVHRLGEVLGALVASHR